MYPRNQGEPMTEGGWARHFSGVAGRVSRLNQVGVAALSAARLCGPAVSQQRSRDARALVATGCILDSTLHLGLILVQLAFMHGSQDQHTTEPLYSCHKCSDTLVLACAAGPHLLAALQHCRLVSGRLCRSRGGRQAPQTLPHRSPVQGVAQRLTDGGLTAHKHLMGCRSTAGGRIAPVHCLCDGCGSYGCHTA